MMDEKLDPERQTHKGFNHQLESFVKPYVNYLYAGKTNYDVVQDIGLEWAAKNGIKKKFVRGEAIWIQEPADKLDDH